jgi:putative hemolysin
MTLTELEISDSDHAQYDTMAGYLLSILGNIPSTGDLTYAQGWKFEVVDMDGLRIDKILMQKLV